MKYSPDTRPLVFILWLGLIILFYKVAMEQDELRQIPLVSLFAALAIIFPQFFHFLGLGPAFLPMFIPVIVGSMFLSLRYVIALAIFSPTMSWLITGMPPIAPPVLPTLILELIVVGIVVSLLRRKTRLQVWFILLISIIADRLILFALVVLIAPLFDIRNPLFTIALVSAGIPGIILQILTVPLTVKLIEKKYPHWRPGKRK